LRGGVRGGGAPRTALSARIPSPSWGGGTGVAGGLGEPLAPNSPPPSPMRGGVGGGGPSAPAEHHPHPHDHQHHPYPHADHPLGPKTLPKIPGKRAREERE
jgi:hypothetical protein